MLGFYHRPRSAAPPLVLDMMELFRTTLREMPLIGSVKALSTASSRISITML